MAQSTVEKYMVRRVLHFNMTMSPSAEWTAQQIVQAFPYADPPRYLLRDRDHIYCEDFKRRVHGLGIEEIVSAPRSPWQNPYVERLIGTIRRECLDHVIVISEQHLMRILRSYFSYYHSWRTHQSLDMDAPDMRAIQAAGEVIEIPGIGGLHHHYDRLAAQHLTPLASLATTTLHAAQEVKRRAHNPVRRSFTFFSPK